MDKQELKNKSNNMSIFGRIKFKILKRFAKTNKGWNRIKNRIDNKSHTLDSYQEKAIKLWDLCLHDKEAQIYCSISTFKRQIEKDDLLIILAPTGNRNNGITIIDMTDGHHNCFNINFSDRLEGVIDDLKEAFDVEMEKRVRYIEFSKKEIMNKDLDHLVSVQSAKYVKTEALS
jgi:hypothetical protein